MIDMVMKGEVGSALCWWTMRWRQDDSQMGEDQDSTLVFCESTSRMLMTSVLTPLSYIGLSKADSSVMLSYGGEDAGILIDFPWSLSKELRNRENPVWARLIPNEINKVWSYYLLCEVDINPEDNHQDDCSWNKDCKGNVGSLHAIIHINNCKEKEHKNRYYFCEICTKKKYQYIDTAVFWNMAHHLACVRSHTGLRMLQRHNCSLVSI